MITFPVHIDTPAIFAFKLVLAASLLGPRAARCGRVFISSIHTIWITIAHPLLRDTFRSLPQLVLFTFKLGSFVTLSVVALHCFIFIRTIQTIVITIAEVYSRNAVTIITCEKVTKASLLFGFTVLLWLVTAIIAVRISVAVPCCWNAAMIRTSEAVRWAGPRSTVQRIFVAVIPAVVVSVAKPVRLHTDGGVPALMMIPGACNILSSTCLHGLITGCIILTVID